MKTLLTTFALGCALSCAAAGEARAADPSPGVGSVLLTEAVEGNQLVRKYLVRNTGDEGYVLFYRIDAAQLASDYADNGQDLSDLDAFVGSLPNDELRSIRRIVVTGYASPDGPQRLNEQLARERAEDVVAYLDNKYELSEAYGIAVEARIASWDDVREAVAASDAPQREAVLRVLDSDRSDAAKQAALRRQPAAWRFLSSDVLPALRRVDLRIDYGQDRIVEVRTRIARPAPRPAPAPEPRKRCCCAVVDDGSTGLLVEMPEPGVDF